MPEHHGGRKDHSGRIGPVCSHDIASDMPASWLKKSIFLERADHFSAVTVHVWVRTYRSHVAPWDDARSTDKGGANVGNDRAIEVGHDHDVELLRLSDQLHRAMENDVSMKLGEGGRYPERACYPRSCRCKLFRRTCTPQQHDGKC